jgi:histidine ammonia-lyase
MIILDGQSLTIADIVQVSRKGAPVALSSSAREKMAESHQWVQSILQNDRPVYGINTGFGYFSERYIPPEDVQQLNRNLILSHSVSTGDPLPTEVVQAAMLIRANTLAKGYSGVRPEVCDTLIAMLNKGVTPIIPEQGSLGSSGDLAPLACLALAFTTDEEDDEALSGWAEYQGKRMSGKSAMEMAGIPRLILEAKEGLALTNGATFSAALAALAVHDAQTLIDTAEITLAMSLEAMLGCSHAFDARIHALRNHPGQQKVAARVRELTQGSELLDAAGRVQDAYSTRCAPQVQGAARDIWDFVAQVVEVEVNSATDNPLLFGPDTALSGGNFHGEPIGLAMDYLGIALAEVAAIAERRVYRLMDSALNAGLPPMLVDRPEMAGIHSGMMMPHYTAASLVLENSTLAHPDSVHSLPTSGEQEDHNANAMTAARHARQIIANTAHVLAVEALVAARALDLRLRQMPEARMGSGVRQACENIRSLIPYHAEDTWRGPQIERLKESILQGDVIRNLSAHEG